MALVPDPIAVDVAAVEVGAVEVAVEEDGRTRARDRHVVTSPVAGTLRRVELRAGDAVAVGQALVRIDGPESGIPDARTAEQLRIRLDAAEAGIEQARSMVGVAEAALLQARDDRRRVEVLVPVGGASESAMARAEALVRAREAELRSATFGVQVAESQAADLRAALAPSGGAGRVPLALTSPVNGVVLRVHRESAGAVGPGEPILELGDLSALEVVVDLLSADAVRVPLGAEARITGWGGPEVLHARVRSVEPGGFTRVSALGIEEQRVNVILDPEGGAESWGRLGDQFRVETRIVLDRAENVLRVPSGALFRRGQEWAVFRVVEGRATETVVQLGRRSQAEAEVLSGLAEGDLVIAYPGDRVADGTAVQAR
jgi:HlyD family secretion protein